MNSRGLQDNSVFCAALLRRGTFAGMAFVLPKNVCRNWPRSASVIVRQRIRGFTLCEILGVPHLL
jgi:hypothetical protein